MAIEIERRFLVKGESWKRLAKNCHTFRQGYLATISKKWTIRIRIVDEEIAWLTLKTKSQGISQHEFEYKIPLEDAKFILMSTPYKLKKKRYEINFKGSKWVVDSFEGENAPLVIAEIELISETEAIKQPDWCGEEITGNSQWSNAALATNPFSKR